MKTCTKCYEEKEKSSFSRHSLAKDGLHTRCNKCRAIENRKYRKDVYKRYHEKYPNANIIAYGKKKLFARKHNLGTEAIRRLGLELALFIYKRADWRCEACFTTEDLTIHHKDRNGRNKRDAGLPENNDKDNLEILCRSCHGKIHTKQRFENIKIDAERRK